MNLPSHDARKKAPGVMLRSLSIGMSSGKSSQCGYSLRLTVPIGAPRQQTFRCGWLRLQREGRQETLHRCAKSRHRTSSQNTFHCQRPHFAWIRSCSTRQTFTPAASSASAPRGRHSGREDEVVARQHGRRYQDKDRSAGASLEASRSATPAGENSAPHIAPADRVPAGWKPQPHAATVADRANGLSVDLDIHGQPCPGKLRWPANVDRSQIRARRALCLQGASS